MVFQTLWGLCSSVLVCNYARFHARVMWWLSSKFKNKYVNGIASGDDANTLSRFSEQNGDKNVRHARYARLAIFKKSFFITNNLFRAKIWVQGVPKRYWESWESMRLWVCLFLTITGIMFCPEWKTEDGFDMQFGTNHLGHFLLTELITPLLVKSASLGSDARYVKQWNITCLVCQVQSIRVKMSYFDGCCQFLVPFFDAHWGKTRFYLPICVWILAPKINVKALNFHAKLDINKILNFD